MGYKTLSPSQITTITPASKDVVCKAFQVARTNTSSSVVMMLPADASVIAVIREKGTASDAGTSATVTLTLADNGGTVSSAADDVKTDGGTTGFVQMTSLPNVEPLPPNGDFTLTAVYAETGTASSTGGPWKYIVQYVR